MTLAFFRRHQKWFMVLMFLSIISMVFFTTWDEMWSALGSLFGSSGPRQVVGTIDGRAVRAIDAHEFYVGVKAAGIGSLMMEMTLAQGRDLPPDARARVFNLTRGMTAWEWLSTTFQGDGPDRGTLLAWMALYEEARRRGFEATAAEVDARLALLDEMGVTRQMLTNIAGQLAAGNWSAFHEGLRQDMTLRAYLGWLNATLGQVVEPELRGDFARMDERIQVRLAVLRAEDFDAAVAAVPDDAVQAQFDKYKNVLAGQGPDGYGYRVPDQVAVEYLVADPKGFEDEAAKAVDDAAVRAYYDANRDAEFVIPDEKPADDAKADDSKADEKPAAKKYRPLDEVRQDILKTLTGREASRLAAERLSGNVAEVRAMKTPPDLGIWADGRKVRFVVVPGKHSAAQLAALPGIGTSRYQGAAFAQYAVMVQELVGPEKARLAVGEISDAFTGEDGAAYAFRVTAVEKNHAPASLADVRDAVVADVRRALAFGIAREEGRKLLAAAADGGLEKAAEAAKVKTVETDWFPRERSLPYGNRWIPIPVTLPEVGESPALVSECFQMTADDRRRTLVTLAERQMVVVAELAGRKAPREAMFDAMRPLLVQRVGMEISAAPFRNVLSLDAIRRRMKVIVEDVEPAVTSPDGEPLPAAEPVVP
jgi:hypothetical protein